MPSAKENHLKSTVYFCHKKIFTNCKQIFGSADLNWITVQRIWCFRCWNYIINC